MKKLLRLTVMFLICGLTTATYAQFPYNESFKNSTAQGINFGGAPSAFLTAGGDRYDIATLSHQGTPIDENGKGFLRLTNATFNQKGFIYSNSVFPASLGLRMQFEYFVYGGTGADGISFFLFDATTDPFNIGGFGGSLGYAQITTTTPTSPGVSKGYIGVGLDEFGNFSNPTEGRQGGIPGQSVGSVTLRGKGNGDALTANNYPFLTSVKTSTLGFDLVGNSATRQPDSTSTNYRRVSIQMAPNPTIGYNITVIITRGGSKLTSTTVINNYHYPEAAPAMLRYGVASSTGASTNFHEIRNVFIDVLAKDQLVAPVATNDNLTVCEGNQAMIDISLNDRTVNTGSSINKSTIDLDPTTSGIQKTFTIAGKGIFSINADQNVIFTPENTFKGIAVANYNIQDFYGKISNNATITITYAAGLSKPEAGADQLLNITTPTTSSTLQGSNQELGNGTWTQVSGPGQATFTNPKLYNTVVSNLASGAYTFRWTVRNEGGCELFDEVQLIVNHPPVANNDVLTTFLNTSANALILNNDTDPEGNNTIDRSSIIIVNAPQDGNLSIDPLSGIVTYTPNNGFSGTDSFVYTIKDNFGVVSNPATVNISVSSTGLPGKIGLAKALTGKTRNADGSYDLIYTFTLVNFSGIESITNVSLTDDLDLTFKKNRVIIIRLTATGNLNVNSAYNGFTIKEMLLPSSILFPTSKEQVVLEVNVSLDQNEGVFNNTAIAQGISSAQAIVTTDQSTDGLTPDPVNPGDVSPATPTPVKLEEIDLFIPGGFSPNHDGINDYFVIENAANAHIQLEIYNRWGNRIYKSSNYRNEWNGKTTEGVHIGEDVPVGTYYYIIKIDGKSKKAGPLTITR